MVTTPFLPQDRLIAKEVALGVVREYEPPQDHIGLALLAPFKDVASDEAIFEYTHGLSAGLAPARAEDAESELAQKDDSIGFGRASLIDWALKDHYDPSDITRFRDALIISNSNTAAQLLSLPLTVTSILDSFQDRVARDTMLRRKKLDNRIEWMITQACWTGKIVYNDGKIVFSVDYGRPASQTAASSGGSSSLPTGHYWNDNTNGDPINDIMQLQDWFFNTRGVKLARCIINRRILHSMLNNVRFQTLLTGANPLYTVADWGYARVLEVLSQRTEIDFTLYDSVFRTRPLGSNTFTNTRFTDPHQALFLPSQADLDSLDDAIGFGKTLTSPHVEGNWTSGYYEWEQETRDPWSHDIGTGIKAFPVFPHMGMTLSVDVLDPAYTDPITGTTPGLTFTVASS